MSRGRPDRGASQRYESWTRGSIDFEALIDVGIVNHQPDVPSEHGRDLFRAAVTGVMAAVPDARWEALDLVAEGDRVAVRIQWVGTYQGGRFRGYNVRGPQSFSVEHIHVYRVVNGKLAEHWVVRDDLAMLTELGAFDAQWVPLRARCGLGGAHAGVPGEDSPLPRRYPVCQFWCDRVGFACRRS